MNAFRKYKWQAAHVTIIVGVITTLALVTHLTGTPRPRIHPSGTAAPLSSVPMSVHPARPAQVSSRPRASGSPPSDPREVVVGPSGISNRYNLVSADRKPVSSTVDELTVRLHVMSLATENLVSPFESDMLDITSPGLQPIYPGTSFHTPIPAGNSQNKDVAFYIPASLSLKKAALNIHYYNYQKQIPLDQPSRTGSD
jgi:hypothetical protein